MPERPLLSFLFLFGVLYISLTPSHHKIVYVFHCEIFIELSFVTIALMGPPHLHLYLQLLMATPIAFFFRCKTQKYGYEWFELGPGLHLRPGPRWFEGDSEAIYIYRVRERARDRRKRKNELSLKSSTIKLRQWWERKRHWGGGENGLWIGENRGTPH